MTVTLKWHQHIEAWQQSGLSQAIYCEHQQLKMSTFAARLSEYRRLNQSQAAGLIPVQIEPIAPIPTSSPGLVLTQAGTANVLPGFMRLKPKVWTWALMTGKACVLTKANPY